MSKIEIGVCRVVKARLIAWLWWATLSLLLMRMNDRSLSLRLLCTRQQNGYQLSLESKQDRLIECIANNHKSSCMLAHGYRKEDECLSLPQIGSEWSLLFFYSLCQKLLTLKTKQTNIINNWRSAWKQVLGIQFLQYSLSMDRRLIFLYRLIHGFGTHFRKFSLFWSK